MAVGLPSQTQVIELLKGSFARAGYDIEEVVIDTGARPPRITVVADGDDPLDLDTIAELSRRAATLLDGPDGVAGSYLLEVSSPGVERPLTTEKHFRRARTRKAELVLADGSRLIGRVGETRDGTTTLVLPGRGGELTARRIPLDDIVKAVVQVEFSPPARRELELASRSAGPEPEAGT